MIRHMTKQSILKPVDAYSGKIYSGGWKRPGGGTQPVLEKATGKKPGWNFAKYLIDRQGKAVAFYASDVKPESKELVGAIEKALATK